MEGKWLGAALIIAGCSVGGFSLAARYRYGEFCLEQLIRALEYMTCELQFRAPTLPVLCVQSAQQIRGPASRVLLCLSQELERQEEGNISVCMEKVLRQTREIPEILLDSLRNLALCLGKFDLDGQLQELQSIRESCRRELDVLYTQRDHRIHSYQTLGLCTGAALAILLI